MSAVLLANSEWRNLRHLDSVRIHTRHTTRIQEASLRLQERLLGDLVRGKPIDPATLEDLRREISEIRMLDLHLASGTTAQLESLEAILSRGEPLRVPDMLSALDLARGVLTAEGEAQGQLLARIDADARAGVALTAGVFLALVSLAGMGGWTFRRRILKPLDDLRSLLSRLADRELNVVAVETAHPVLRPLLENYNHLVTRLGELEAEHRSRADSLEQEVRAAAQTLLEQQRTLARAERLAALGEMAGTLAHEVRNPLAGILMGLTNLRRDVGDPALVARIEVLTGEIDRLARLLSGFLAGARHAPEPLRELDVRALATELLALIRYQIPESIRLECRIPAEIRGRLPRDQLRQVLLNLVLNSVRAMQDASGTILVSAERADGRLVLSVCDEGSGFPAEMLNGGPQPFASWRDGGTGLGLAIVRRVVGDLAGELRLENRRPRGACVHLLLPIDRG